MFIILKLENQKKNYKTLEFNLLQFYVLCLIFDIKKKQ